MKITENIDLIDGTTAHCYSVTVYGRIVLVDAGMKGSAKRIINYYNDKQTKPDVVLITHYHPDHVGGLYRISEAFNPLIFVPDREMDVIMGKTRMVPAKSLISHIVASMAKIHPVGNVKPVSSLKLEGIQVVETPGHTPGSTSYYLEGDEAMFVGDAVNNTRDGLKISRAFTLDMEQAEKSRQIIMQHRARLILPGHGSPYGK